MTKGVMQTFADYAVAEQTSTLSDAVRHAAKRAIIDFFSALLPGGVVAPATMLIEAFDEQVGHGRAILYPSGKRAPAPVAAQVPREGAPANFCPRCGEASFIHVEGCDSCLSCGYSKCG